jgi:uncharacterized membrane protein YfcA
MSVFNINEVYFILAGVVVGVTGVGGGSLMTPILISLLGIPAQIAIGTDLLYASASKLCGSAVHANRLRLYPSAFAASDTAAGAWPQPTHHI